MTYSVGIICSDKKEFLILEELFCDEFFGSTCHMITKVEDVRGKRFDELMLADTGNQLPNIDMLLAYSESRLKDGESH